MTSPMFLDYIRTPYFDADPTAESRPGVLLHMPRARSHGTFGFPVARRVGGAYTYRNFAGVVPVISAPKPGALVGLESDPV
jgi:hypothetical protein